MVSSVNDSGWTAFFADVSLRGFIANQTIKSRRYADRSAGVCPDRNRRKTGRHRKLPNLMMSRPAPEARPPLCGLTGVP